MKAVLVALACLAVVCVSLPTLDVRGFSWAENLVFDANENLFVSDTTTGILWRIYLAADRLNYRKDEHISAGSFNKINGLTVSQDGQTLYAVVELAADKNGYLVQIDTNATNSFEILVQTPKVGNGLALHYSSGLFFTTNEGDFVIEQGRIYAIDVARNQTSEAAKFLNGADGCAIDQGNNWLYISEFLGGKIVQYEIRSDGNLRRHNDFSVPGVKSIDDFCLGSNNTQIIGADYQNGTVVIFNADGSSSASYLLMDSLISPTSAKFGVGKDFDNDAVYVTEGGALLAFRRDRRVLQSPKATGISTP